MFFFNYLNKYRTYVPSYKYDFIRFTFNAFVFAFSLEAYLIYFKRYDDMYKSSFKKELEKIKDYDNKLSDKKRKNLLKVQKLKELEFLEEQLNKRNK